jgi:hypothetical protein
MQVDCESKGYTGNNWGDWNDFKITQTVTDQHTRKAQNKEGGATQGTAHILRKVKL